MKHNPPTPVFESLNTYQGILNKDKIYMYTYIYI
jgi:hypothetical protein